MSIKSRIERIESVIKPEADPAGKFGLTLEQWQKIAKGEKLEIPQKQKAAFAGWLNRAQTRQGEAAATMKLYENREEII